MKCPQCWTEKAYRHPQRGFKAQLLACLGMVSMKCHHCYHKFHTPWFSTIGQKMLPPTTTNASNTRFTPINRDAKPTADNHGRRRRHAA